MKRKIIIRSKDGAITILLALMLTPLLGFAALTYDLGAQYAINTRIDSAINLATLAGISKFNEYPANEGNVSSAKTTTLEYLNSNLTMSIPGFSALSSSDENLTLQAGIYNSDNMTFSWDEVAPNINALRVSYTHTSMSIFTPMFMISDPQIISSAIATKQIAGKAVQGSSFPLAITDLSTIDPENNSITLYQKSSGMNNSYFIAFDNTANEDDVEKYLNYHQNSTPLMTPAEVNIGDTFKVNSETSAIDQIYDNVLTGGTFNGIYIVPVVSYNSSENTVTVEGFVAVQFNSLSGGASSSENYISGTLLPGYIETSGNSKGLTLGSGSAPDFPSEYQQYAATSFSIVE